MKQWRVRWEYFVFSHLLDYFPHCLPVGSPGKGLKEFFKLSTVVDHTEGVESEPGLKKRNDSIPCWQQLRRTRYTSSELTILEICILLRVRSSEEEGDGGEVRLAGDGRKNEEKGKRMGREWRRLVALMEGMVVVAGLLVRERGRSGVARGDPVAAVFPGVNGGGGRGREEKERSKGRQCFLVLWLPIVVVVFGRH
ncbi:hypothetical protein HAX54_000177 [Datura stramonium]|uniref:Uncharacterized protein n=1 Tax=Datura stramonium TaxID=4076 RepID=A0ABS8T0P8_DATST|nr:hypothetical protein [Datura stramonium]